MWMWSSWSDISCLSKWNMCVVYRKKVSVQTHIHTHTRKEVESMNQMNAPDFLLSRDFLCTVYILYVSVWVCMFLSHFIYCLRFLWIDGEIMNVNPGQFETTIFICLHTKESFFQGRHDLLHKTLIECAGGGFKAQFKLKCRVKV